MKKRIVPLLALVLSLCILIPVSVAQSAAEGAVQISVAAENGKVKIGGTSVNNGGTHSVRETESAAAIQLEAVPNNGYAFKGWRATGGTVSDSSSAKTQLTIGSTSESVSLTTTFAKTVSVTLEQPENGSISRTDTLTTLTEGSEVELKAEGANGYGLLRWIIKDSTGTDTTDYTLKPLGNTAKLTLGATDLKISAEFSTDAGSFVWDENDSSKNATAQLKDGTRRIDSAADVKITGWNNNAKEDLVITLTPTEDPRKANAPKLFFQIGNDAAGFNSSATVKFKDAATVVEAGKRIKNKTVTYADGYAWEELPFTITDANNKVKNGKIVINYPSKVTVNAVNGTVKVNGSVCNSGSTLQFMADETVSIEAVAADEGYKFQGWTTSATLADRSQTATTLTTTAGTFSLTATFAKTVSVTLEQPENGSISRTDTLTTLTEGSEVELKAEGANGYGLLRWIIKDSTGTDTTDYTLKPLGNTAKLTLGATDLKISAEFSTDAGSFVWDENDSSKNATAQLKDGTRRIDSAADVKITGWNNNAKEDLVITLTPTEDPRKANAPKLFFQIGNDAAGFNSSATVKFKDAATVVEAGKRIKNKTVTYADGYAWEELPFTITDANNKVKNGKIVINYPSKVTVNAVNGTVKVNGSVCNSGSTLQFMADETVSIEAVAADEGYKFQGWTTSATLADKSQTATTLTTTAGTFSLTATFAKTVSVTLEQPENGSISRTDTLTTLTEGSEVELKAEGANGYGLLRWIIKDSTGTDTTDYTLKPLGNTAKLTLGATDLKISAEFSTDAGSFVWDENDSSKNATAQLKDGTRRIDSAADVKITGWNNNAKEDLVITLTPTEDPRKANAPKLFFQIGNDAAGFNSSATVKFKDAATVVEAGKRIKNKTVTYADGYAWEELPFTITDANNKVKNGKIVINYPSKVTVNAVNGTVKVNGSVCNSGSTLQFMADETVSIEAVAADEGYKFQGWTTSATLADRSQTATTLTTTAGTFSLTATFAKTVSVTLEQPENGSISRTDTLTTLTEGSEVELKAEGANGYGLLRWIIKDSTGTDTTDYTLKPLGNTAKLTLGATDLKISAEFSTDAGSFVWDENDSSKNATAQLKDGTRRIDSAADVKITGWNNNAKEDLVITLTPTEDPRKANAPKLFFQIGNDAAGFNSSATVKFKDAATVVEAGKRIKNKTVTYADGYAWEELPFTITDANNKVKNGKIVINYPSKVTVNAVNGTVKVNGSVCNSGSTLQFMADETVSIEAVAAGEGYKFQGWTTSATLADRSQTATTLTTTAGTFSLTATFAKPSDEKTYLSFKWMCDGQDLSGVEHWMLSGGFSDMPYWIYSFADEVTFNEAIENPTKRQWLGSSDEMQSGVAAGTKLLIRLKTQHTFQNDTYLLDNVDISSIPENSLLGNKRAADGNNEMCYVGLKMDGNLSVTANYHKAANVKITADVNDTAMGTVELSPVGTAGYYQEQTTLAMMAVAQDGYRFKEWQEANGTTYLSQSQKTKAMVEFVVGDKPASFTAVFEAAELEPLPITVTTVPNGKATIKINGDAGIVTAKEGQKLTISITDVDEYYLFDCWEIVEKGVEGSGSLLSDTVKFDESVTLIMPGNPGGIEITAKLKDKQYGFSWNQVMLKTGNSYTRNDTLASLTVSIDGIGQEGSSGNIQKGSKIKATVALSDSSAYVMKELFVFKQGASSGKRVATLNDIECEFAIDDWGYYYTWLVLEEKTVDNTRHNIRLTEPGTGGKIQSSNQTAQPNTTITLTAVPDSGYTLKSWIVKDEQQKTISVTADKTNSNVGTFTMPKSNVTVTAEFESTSEITPTITSVALLQGKAGNELATGVLSGDKWTITIPDTVSAETVELIHEGTSGLFLKIVTPTGVTVKQMDGGGSWAGDWSKGDIVCWMPVGEEVTFRVIAGTATKDYTIKLVYSGSPLLSDGSATRSSKTAATVTFTSNVEGTYYYKVVNHSAAAPTVEDILASNNNTARVGVNNITLSNLGDGARDIYIVVVDASNNRSVVLKIEIPAYGSIDVPDTGAYTITVKAPKGGTITPSRTKANAGDEIIITVTPDSGYQMVADSLTYTLAIAGGETVKITNNRFIMPDGNVSISCQWETAATTSAGITGFSINGVAGAVNNTTNTITITMPRGTDVTKLTPVIATNGVKSLTPGSGETVDFTNSVTYTATMEDGSTKTYIVTVYVNKGTLSDQFWDKMTDFTNQVPWWQYAEKQQSTSKYPKYW